MDVDVGNWVFVGEWTSSRIYTCIHPHLHVSTRARICTCTCPYTSTVASTLNDTDLEVIVYQGQLDIICDTKGTSHLF